MFPRNWKETRCIFFVGYGIFHDILNRKQGNMLCPRVYPMNFLIKFPSGFRTSPIFHSVFHKIVCVQKINKNNLNSW